MQMKPTLAGYNRAGGSKRRRRSWTNSSGSSDDRKHKFDRIGDDCGPDSDANDSKFDDPSYGYRLDGRIEGVKPCDSDAHSNVAIREVRV